MLRRLGVIGAGGIADVVLSKLAERLASPLDHIAILARAGGVMQAQALLDRLGSRRHCCDLGARR
jgi:aspartate dehydrogenase